MKRSEIRNAYDQMTPTPEQKSRMLLALLKEEQFSKENTTGKYRSAPSKTHRWSWVPAAAALVFVLMTGIQILGGMNSEELPVQETAPAEATENNDHNAYASVLEQYRQAIREGWSVEQCIQANISFRFASAEYAEANAGYCLVDLDNNGVEELIVGHAPAGDLQIWDIQTIDADGSVRSVITTADYGMNVTLHDGNVICIDSSTKEQGDIGFYTWDASTGFHILDGVTYDGENYYDEVNKKPLSSKEALAITIDKYDLISPELIWLMEMPDYLREGPTSFTNIDGSIEYFMHIYEEVSEGYFPVLEVKPHMITEEDAKRVATALFDDAIFYEYQVETTSNLTKSEIQAKIDRWLPYTSQEAVTALYGYEFGFDAGELVESFVEEYRKLYETAPEEFSQPLCDWTFKKGSGYMYLREDLNQTDMSNYNDEIAAITYVQGVPFRFTVSNRDKEDFRVNNMYAHISTENSPNNIDLKIFEAKFFRTDYPTEEQLSSIKAKAEQMLQQMEIGNWMIDECYVETYERDAFTEHIIHVSAVPVLYGSPAIRLPQISTLRGQEGKESFYYYTDVQFEFSANGDLVYFSMYSPIDIVGTVEGSEDYLGVNELMEIAKEYLVESEVSNFSFIPGIYSSNSELVCTIDITGLDYNLVRINSPKEDGHFYYVPGITLTGDVKYYAKDSSKTIYEMEDITLLVLNGVDGSKIERYES